MKLYCLAGILLLVPIVASVSKAPIPVQFTEPAQQQTLEFKLGDGSLSIGTFDIDWYAQHLHLMGSEADLLRMKQFCWDEIGGCVTMSEMLEFIRDHAQFEEETGTEAK